MREWLKWGMKEEDTYTTLVAAGVSVSGHHVFSAGAHSPMKMIFRRLNEPGKEHIRDRLDRALAHRIMVETRRHGLTFEAITGPATGGLGMARRLAPILSEILGREIPVIVNRKLSSNDFELVREENPEGMFSVLIVEDVITSGGSLRRLMSTLLDAGTFGICGVFAFVNREGQTADRLGVPCFSALVDRLMPSFKVKEGELCPQCAAGIEISPHH